MKHTKKSKKVKVFTSTQDYAGTEASPYQQWLERSGEGNSRGTSNEPPEANPDVLPEEAGLYAQSACSDPRLEVVKGYWNTLTEQQQQILQLCGYQGRTIDSCAQILKVKRSTVQKVLERLRRKFERLI